MPQCPLQHKTSLTAKVLLIPAVTLKCRAQEQVVPNSRVLPN